MKSVHRMASEVAGRLQSVLVAATVLTPDCRAIVRQFRAARALSPDRAQSSHSQGWFADAAFGRLQRRGIIRETTPGRYYLDQEALSRVEGAQ